MGCSFRSQGHTLGLSLPMQCQQDKTLYSLSVSDGSQTARG